MKTNYFKSGIVAAFLMFFIIGTELNTMASPPPWAPAHGYKAKTRYIYFPEQNIYYDLKTNRYIYPNNNIWIFGAALPTIFGPVNLVSARQVELDYYYSQPYKYNYKHVVLYDSPYKVKEVKMKPNNGKDYHQKGPNGNYNGKSKGKERDLKNK